MSKKKYSVRKVYSRANEYKVKVGAQPPFDGIFSETRFDLTIVDESGSDDFPLFNLYKESLTLQQYQGKQFSFIDESSKRKFYEILNELQKDSDFMEALKEYRSQKAALLKEEQKQKHRSGTDGLGLLEQEERILNSFICERVINYKQEDSEYKLYIHKKNMLRDDYISLLSYIQEHYPQQTHPLAVYAATGLYHIQMAREAIESNDAMKAAYYTGLAVQRRYMSGIHADFEKSHFQAIARRSYGATSKNTPNKGNTRHSVEERQKIVNEVERLHNEYPSLSANEACKKAASKINLDNSYINMVTGKELKRSLSAETFRKWKEVKAIFKK